jgi:XTP/dITP diphosphohydrolase
MSRSSARSADRPGALLLASRSAGKIREIRALFAAQGFEIVDLNEAGVVESADEASVENETTFEGNALAKARHFHARTGVPTIADDSGIEVLALGGAPGIYSKRWSARPELGGQALDDANNQLLLSRLRDTNDRRARYVCAAAFCDGDIECTERGEVRGRITRERRGDGGFGYDPYFEADELGRTFAEVSMEEKALVSHRARAFARLLARLRSGMLR